jgi:hypothetical protein
MEDRLTEKPKRFRFAVSVRTLIVLVLMTGIGASWTVRRATAQRRAMEMIQRIGGSLTFRHQMINGKYEGDAEPFGPRWLRDRLGQEYFVEVVGANFSSRPVTDGELAWIPTVKKTANKATGLPTCFSL